MITYVQVCIMYREHENQKTIGKAPIQRTFVQAWVYAKRTIFNCFNVESKQI